MIKITTKNEIRNKLKKKRILLSKNERDIASKSIYKKIITSSIFLNSKKIAFYYPIKGEINPIPIMQEAFNRNKEVFLPVLTNFPKYQIKFQAFSFQNKIEKNKFQINQPRFNHVQTISPWAIDLVFVPLVAFDQNNNRLGMGMGYYDRKFHYLLNRQRWIKPKLIGLAYDFQQIKTIKANSWDVKLNKVFTDK